MAAATTGPSVSIRTQLFEERALDERKETESEKLNRLLLEVEQNNIMMEAANNRIDALKAANNEYQAKLVVYEEEREHIRRNMDDDKRKISQLSTRVKKVEKDQCCTAIALTTVATGGAGVTAAGAIGGATTLARVLMGVGGSAIVGGGLVSCSQKGKKNNDAG